ncbi:MAG: cytochrome c [Alphaproteobacteria bacterium]|nr:cytochrome c [Alphaproteobacteria bacterium]
MNIRFAFSRKILVASLAVAAVGALALPALSATPAETVKLRQETMKQLGGHMKAIKSFAMEGQGSAEDVAKRAGEIGEIAARIPSLFPEGTGMDEVLDPKNGAKPEIWLDWDNFLKARASLEAQSRALAAAAGGGDQAAIRAAFQNLGKNGCGNCHKPYRIKLEK